MTGRDTVADRLADEDLAAPHLIDAEVGHALRGMVGRTVIDESLARGMLGDLADVEIVRFGHTALLPRAWELRENLTIYDALYIALAEAMDVPLVTLDKGLAGVPGTSATVEVLGA